jgi:hypothetical protein
VKEDILKRPDYACSLQSTALPAENQEDIDCCVVGEREWVPKDFAEAVDTSVNTKEGKRWIFLVI